MSLGTFLTINAVLAVGFGVSFVVVPTTVAELYGLSLGEAGIFVGRLFGSILLFVAIIAWRARSFGPGAAVQAVVLAGLVGDAIGLVVAVSAQLAGTMNAVGWSAVALYAFLTLGYGYFQFASSPEPAPA